MDNYKKKIRRRIVVLSVFVLIAVLLSVYDVFFLSKSEAIAGSDVAPANFQIGLLVGLGMVALIHRIKLAGALKDDHKLKMLYNREHDERLKTIRVKAGMPVLMISSLLIIVAAIITGYYNSIVFYALLITGTAQLLMGLILKVYYMRVI